MKKEQTTILTPADSGWDNARLAWNPAIDSSRRTKVTDMNTCTITQPTGSSTAVTTTTTVADYLLTRLSQAGVISVFGVPGDYNLGILDAIAARPALAWQGMATEQGAGHAADSYARLRGLGAVVTTFGVGELSAINAIAGAYAESVPVVHIVGTPALTARNTGVTLHHNLPGGDFRHFARMAAEVTAAQADLRPATAPAEIDRVLDTAVRTSRPVYIAIPADVASAPVPAPRGRLPQVGEVPEADPAVRTAFARDARGLLDAAASASVLVGHLAARHRVTSFVRDLAAAGGLPVAMLATAKGDFPESHPSFAGLRRRGLGQARPGRRGGHRRPHHRRSRPIRYRHRRRYPPAARGPH